MKNYRRNREAKLEKDRARRAADPEKHRARDRARYESRREAQLAYSAEWRKRNRDKCNAYEARRRAKLKGAQSLEVIDRKAIYERDNGICHICRRKVSARRFHLDHLVPVSRGGDHVAANVAVAHPLCNNRRFTGRIPAQLRLIG